ncbi:MAG: FkbM family methyltransferase [Pseudomonadota bacterium]
MFPQLRHLDPKLWVLSALLDAPHPKLRRFARVRHANRVKSWMPKPDIRKIVAGLPESTVVIDFGANAGLITRALAVRARVVHAVEADPDIFAVLKENCADLDNVVLHHFAISDRSGEAIFHRESDAVQIDRTNTPDCGTLHQNHSRVAGAGATIKTPVMGIEEFLRQIDEPVDFIKMDIEGAEVEVLEALFDSPYMERIGQISVETHEFWLPETADRMLALRRRARSFNRPEIDFNWR